MYIVKKDGLYLAGFQDTGVRGYDSTGEYIVVQTGLYSDRKSDAIMLKSKMLAESFGGEVINIKEGRRKAK